MPTVVLFNLPLAGHMPSALGVTAELAARGVRVVAWGTQEYRAAIEAAGGEFRDYGAWVPEDYEPPVQSLMGVAADLADIAERLFPAAAASVVEERADVVAFDSMAPWGRIAAQHDGAPAVSLTSTFLVDPVMFRSPTLAFDLVRDALTSGSARRRLKRTSKRMLRERDVRLGGLPDVMGGRGDRTVVFTSAAFQPHAERFDDSVRFVGPTLAPATPGSDPGLLDALGDESIVYVALGTLHHDRPAFYRGCFEALGGGSERILVSIGADTDPAALGPVPGNVVVRPSVPHSEVLERAAVFVSHGGMNSVSESLAAGVPVVLWPQQPEQALVARRVRDLGAGVLLGRRPSAADIGRAVEEVRGAGYREAAAAVGATLRQAGGRGAAADEIERLFA